MTSRRGLLICGVLSSLLYVGIDQLAAVRHAGYHDFASQTISELGARGAPTRQLVNPLFILYDLLTIAFGVGVWLSARGNRPLRVAAAALTAVGVVGLPGPWLFPMNLRGVGGDVHAHRWDRRDRALHPDRGGVRRLRARTAVPRLFVRDPGRDPRVRRADERPGQGARHRRSDAVDRHHRAALHRRVPAVGRGAGDRAAARRRAPGRHGGRCAHDSSRLPRGPSRRTAGSRPGFEEVRAEFERNFAERGEIGAAVAAYWRGEKVVDLWGGRRAPDGDAPWNEDTMVVVNSTTKGLAAMTVAVANARGWLDYDAPVARYWPEFAQNGKGEITVRQLLGHEAGLVSLDEILRVDKLSDLDDMARLLARQKPAWPPGTRHGYHAMTIGLYMQELIRRVDPAHRTLGRFFHEEIARPLRIESSSTSACRRRFPTRGWPR